MSVSVEVQLYLLKEVAGHTFPKPEEHSLKEHYMFFFLWHSQVPIMYSFCSKSALILVLKTGIWIFLSSGLVKKGTFCNSILMVACMQSFCCFLVCSEEATQEGTAGLKWRRRAALETCVGSGHHKCRVYPQAHWQIINT